MQSDGLNGEKRRENCFWRERMRTIWFSPFFFIVFLVFLSYPTTPHMIVRQHVP